MSLVSPAELLAAAAPGTGVAAVNVILTEHLEAFVLAAESRRTGLIVQLSQNAVGYHGSLAPIGVAVLEAARRSTAPIAVQLDHADDPALIREAAALGFTSVMYDGSKLAYDRNVETTATLAAELHRAGIWVEAELGEIGGKDGVHSGTARTDPDDAAAFVASTGVDGLAVAVGSSHAMRDQSAVIDLDLIRAIRGRVAVPLVLHGSSGVGDDLVRAACAAGIRKVNFGTRFNAVLTASVRETLAASPGLIDPRAYLAAARDAVSADAAHVLDVVSAA